MLSFACLMGVVAIRLWQQADRPTSAAQPGAPASPRNADGTLNLTPGRIAVLGIVGIITGFLSGLFGIGGGFIIVPALILFSEMPIHRAVGTSLLVIVLVSIVGVTSQILAGHKISLEIAPWFILGGFAGLQVAGQIGRHLSGPVLQKIFVVAMLLVAAFVISRHLTA